MMVWFLVIWGSVIPNPYPTLELCNQAMGVMDGVFDSNLVPIYRDPPFPSAPGTITMDSYGFHLKSWCIPAPKKD